MNPSLKWTPMVGPFGADFKLEVNPLDRRPVRPLPRPRAAAASQHGSPSRKTTPLRPTAGRYYFSRRNLVLFSTLDAPPTACGNRALGANAGGNKNRSTLPAHAPTPARW